MGRGAWWATVHGVAKRKTRLRTKHSTYHLTKLLNVSESLFPYLYNRDNNNNGFYHRRLLWQLNNVSDVWTS